MILFGNIMATINFILHIPTAIYEFLVQTVLLTYLFPPPLPPNQNHLETASSKQIMMIGFGSIATSAVFFLSSSRFSVFPYHPHFYPATTSKRHVLFHLPWGHYIQTWILLFCSNFGSIMWFHKFNHLLHRRS